MAARSGRRGGQLSSGEGLGRLRIGGAGLAKVEGLCDGRGGQGVVARDHLDLDSGVMAGPDGLEGFVPWRVDHALQPQEHQTLGDVLMRDLVEFDRQVFHREGQHPQTVGGHLRRLGLDPLHVHGGLRTVGPQLG